MLPQIQSIRQNIKNSIAAFRAEGHDVEGLHEELAKIPDSYDALDQFERVVASRPMRADWPYIEPDDLEGIWKECDSSRPLQSIGELSASDAAARVETAFLSSVCGCILGKPLEVDPTLEEIKQALEQRNEWPLRDYISEELNLRGIHKFNPDVWHTSRESIRYAAPDDDINYTILGMLNLEQHGVSFTARQLASLWRRHQSLDFVWGPERTILAHVALRHWEESMDEEMEQANYTGWVRHYNPEAEKCGAMIRADAYGYACPGRPTLAAELAWRDASFTHRKTGVYSTMFVAAAIAMAFVERDRLAIFETALKFVPQRSRFYEIIHDSLKEVSAASDWIDGYNRIHGKYKQYSHCLVYQECGTLINTLRFATSIDDGFCKQVSQGNDTDSFGATSGSILGAYFGPGHLDSRWLKPFQDEIRTGLNLFYDRSLSALAKRMAKLPEAILNTSVG